MNLLFRVLLGRPTQDEDTGVGAHSLESSGNFPLLPELKHVIAFSREQDTCLDPGEPPRAREIIRWATARELVSRRRRRRSAWTLTAAAAAAVLGWFTFGMLPSERWGPRVRGPVLIAEDLTTGAGEFATVRMSDGTVVRLGPESRLQMMSGGRERQVVLVGRAFFAVAPEVSHPFWVHTPAGSIRVLGTRFQVEAGLDDMSLIVVEGAVSLATGRSEVQVAAGEMTQVRSGKHGNIQKAPGLAELSSEWIGKFLAFQETPLATATREIEQVYDVEIRILDPRLGEKSLTMWFSSRPLEEVLTVVCSVINASCQMEGGVVSVTMRN